MKTMFIGQCSSIVDVCVVYDLNSLVYHLIAYINPINKEKEKKKHTHRNTRKERREYLRDIHNKKSN
jgi:hypothetical protein